MCISLPGYCAKGEIEFLRYERDKVVDGRKCLKLHFRMKVTGLKGKDIDVTAYFESPKGKGLTDTNGKYRTKGGKVSVSRTDDATYESTRWNDFTLTIPNDEIHALPGKNTYYVEALLRYGDTVLARTYCEPFTMTGGSSAKSNEENTVKHSNSQSNRHVTKTWVENSTRNGFVKVTLYSDGTKINQFFALCPNCRGTSLCGLCHGTGVCALCQGQGGHYLAAAGYWNPCTMCNATGRCSSCGSNGGKCNLCNGSLGHDHPGYVCNSTQTIYPDGRSFTDKAGYNWTTGRRDGGNSTAKKKSCSTCHGTGVSPTASSSAPSHEWIAQYIESWEKCPYCHRTGAHWHSRCPNCNVPTHY